MIASFPSRRKSVSEIHWTTELSLLSMAAATVHVRMDTLTARSEPVKNVPTNHGANGPSALNHVELVSEREREF